MNALTPIRLGSITPIPNMRIPLQGAQGLPVELDFTTESILDGDLAASFQSGVFDYVQSVFIDNKSNPANFELTAPGLGNRGRTIRAQPFSQGWYPFTPPVGDGRFIASTTPGLIIPLIFANIPMPFTTWGPVPGALVVPVLTNSPVNFAATGVGANILVAPVGGQVVSVYRLFYTVGAGALISLRDSAGNRWTGDMNTFAGGGASFQASGSPWFVGAVGAGIDIWTDAAIQLGGQIGFTQA